MVNRKFIERFYNDKSVTNVAVYLNPETDANSWVNSIQKEFPNLFIRTNKKLRTESLEIFKQTFSVMALETLQF